MITAQLGYPFHYDCTKEDGWMEGALEGFEKASAVEQELPMYKRPCKKLVWQENAPTTTLKSENGTHFLYDFKILRMLFDCKSVTETFSVRVTGYTLELYIFSVKEAAFISIKFNLSEAEAYLCSVYGFTFVSKSSTKSIKIRIFHTVPQNGIINM